MTMRRFLFIIPVLGTSLLWAEEKPATVSDAVSETPPVVKEKGKPESSASSGESQERKGKKGEWPGSGHHGRRGLFWKDMDDAQRERLLYYHHLIIRRYDLNRNGVLEQEEMEAMKKDSRRFREERRQLILKKFDKNGDGKLDEEERKAIRVALRADIERRLKERKEGKADDDGDLPPPPPGKMGREGHFGVPEPGMEKKKEGEEKRAEGEGKDGAKEGRRKGKHGHERGRGWGPEGMIMSLGYHLMMEKFDKDKDGKLSQEERKAYDEDRRKFGKWLKGMRKKLKDQGCLEEVEKNPPPIIMAPSEPPRDVPPVADGEKE